QQSLGCDTVWLESEAIEARWPVISGPDHVGGTFGPSDGSVDPHAVLHGYRAKARSQGVTYLAAEVTSLIRTGDRVSGVELADGSTLHAGSVINCAGAWGAALLSRIGVEIPVIPVRRSVYVIETAIASESLPSVFLPTGPYLVPEGGGTFVVGWSRPSDPVGVDFGFSRDRFADDLWPELVRWLPDFDALHVRGGWSGLYAVNTLDANAIIGAWPTIDGLYVCTGFSGHGFQQCHAVGRYIAEQVVGRDHELDLSRLGPERILTNTPIHENPGRLI
ncbi:MAG: FAD-binding oxidoreductase, partial [Acidimicrobiia bacterium]|nr:FAD-binding oxidoreductase [Acidimicrobiia bacterium]